MLITRLNVAPMKRGDLLALASITFDDEFVVHGLRLVVANRGPIVAMPEHRHDPAGDRREAPRPEVPEGRRAGPVSRREVAHPVTSSFRRYVEDVALSCLRECEGDDPCDFVLERGVYVPHARRGRADDRDPRRRV